MKKVIKKIILTLIIITIPYTINTYGKNLILDDKEKIDILLSENLLEEIYIEDLIIIKDKINDNEALSKEDIELIQYCEQDIIKKKVGEEVFEEYKKLIEKRKSNPEFTQEERYRIYEIEKEIKEYKSN